MKIGYVVLYVNDANACFEFWKDKIGMVEKNRNQFGDFSIIKVGFADQEASFELVPIEMMKNNPDGLDLATPSIAFYVENLQETHSALTSKNVSVSEIAEHSGMQSFAFSDNENRWFAVIQN